MAATMMRTPNGSRPQLARWGWLGRTELLCAVIVLCHLPLVWLQFQRAWQIDSYLHAPFLLLAIVGLMVQRWRNLESPAVCRPGWASLMMLIVGLGLLAASVALRSPWLGTVSLVVSLLGLLLSFGSEATVRLLPVWMLLWLLLPLPFRWDQRLTLVIQDLSSRGGSALLDLWGLNHVLAGFVLELPGRALPVEDVSGGIAPLFAAVSAAAVLAVWLQRGILHGSLLIASSVFWGMGFSVIGFALAVDLLASGWIDVTSGGPQASFSAGSFAAMLLVLISTDRLLLFLFDWPFGRLIEEEESLEEEFEEEDALAVDVTPAPARAIGAFSLFWLLTLGFLAVGFWQVAAWESVRSHGRGPSRATTLSAGQANVPWGDVLTEASLPQLPGAWKMVGFHTLARAHDSDLGRFSVAWRYVGERDEAVISVDFPLDVRHQPIRAFEVRGWEIESYRVLSDSEFDQPVLEFWMRDGGGRRGYVLVHQRTEDGEVIEPSHGRRQSFIDWWESLREQVLERFGKADPSPGRVQISLSITGDLPLNAQQRTEATEAFRASVDRITELMW
ncbi:MAG: hypothetical protein EA424_12915 [Planctomycetaceae bacterium]|nr:MAG: hypothetical protein EA424_12915 [Planctomycetaceae bacterium]